MAAAAEAKVPAVTYFALLVDDYNPKLVMILDPHHDQPDKPFWKLIGHKGLPHKVLRPPKTRSRRAGQSR